MSYDPLDLTEALKGLKDFEEEEEQPKKAGVERVGYPDFWEVLKTDGICVAELDNNDKAIKRFKKGLTAYKGRQKEKGDPYASWRLNYDVREAEESRDLCALVITLTKAGNQHSPRLKTVNDMEW